MTARFVLLGHDSVAEGRRACQAEADKTPVKPYRVKEGEVRGNEARVVLAVADGTRLTFWLIPHGVRGWRIDGYEERPPGDDSIEAADVIAAFERETGERLERLPELAGGTYETVGFPELLDPGGSPEDVSERFLALVERFGAFNVLVAFSAEDAKRVISGPGPDSRGIHWRRPRGHTLWTAEKRYENVVLSWTGRKTKRTDRGFDRLDGILRRAVATAR